MKYVIVLAFIAILASLAAAGVFMLKRDPNSSGTASSKRMARALTWRIGLSVLLFLLVILSHQLGWLQPSSIPLR
jgi:hypothetical protein